MIRAAIFDADGTLLDSMGIWETLGADYLRAQGLQPRPGLARVLAPMSMKQAARYFRQEYGLPLTEAEITAGLNGMLERYYREDVQLKPGALAFLRQLRERGIAMCIATATDRTLMEAALTRCGALDCFSRIFTCGEVGYGKDQPTIYRAALTHLGTKKQETLVFEDALHALATAKADGFPVVGVFDPWEPRQAQIKALADQYLADYREISLEKILKQGAKLMKAVLSIAGSDCSGGAGIQADLKTMTMNGVYGMSAITALTAQNTTGVRAIREVSPDFLQQQLDVIFEDIFPDAVKIGMVPSAELIQVIADRLRHYDTKHVVVDPVMVATSGAALMQDAAVAALQRELLPLADLVTPNIPEAEVLSGMKISGKADMLAAAASIGGRWGCGVLLKGGHSIQDANDLLYTNGKSRWFAGKRIENPNTHGTGCTLSSAIASNLAKGFSLGESVQRAKEYISGALAAMLDLGSGSGPMDHAFALTGRFAEED